MTTPPKRLTRFSSIAAELEAIDAKAASWTIRSKTEQNGHKLKLILLAHQAHKFTANARAAMVSGATQPQPTNA